MIALARWLSPTMRLNAARASSMSGRSRDSQRWPASAFAANRGQRLIDLVDDGGRHLAHRHPLAHARHFRLRLPERVVLGHVAQEADEQQATTIDRSNRQFDGKLLAILSDGGYLDATASTVAWPLER